MESRKLALQRSISELRKQLWQEEEVHRALERAFTRPIGAPPHAPAHLPSQTIDLVTGLAVVEEEVLRLDEMVNAYQVARLDRLRGGQSSTEPPPSPKGKKTQQGGQSSTEPPPSPKGKKTQQGGQSSTEPPPSPNAKKTRARRVIGAEKASAANRLAEDLVRCLLTIFSGMAAPPASGQDQDEGPQPQDPYGTLVLGSTDVGPYSRLIIIDAATFASVVNARVALKLKSLLRKLDSVDLVGLSHQQKLAFWINIFNSCMMNAFLVRGIPTEAEKLVAMLRKVTIMVSGRAYSASYIEQLILRVNQGVTVDEDACRLDRPEPLVTFALSCGSWSSPAVRVYTAARVKEELEDAKRDYLQAAVGVSARATLAIPRLLHWYLLDFAKDEHSLFDWVCLQLPAVAAAAAASRSCPTASGSGTSWPPGEACRVVCLLVHMDWLQAAAMNKTNLSGAPSESWADMLSLSVINLIFECASAFLVFECVASRPVQPDSEL